MLQSCYEIGATMKWVIDYFEQEDTTQPAEVFEDALDRTYPKLSGKLVRVVFALQLYGHQLGGGYLEKCHDYEGLWEIRVIHNRTLARELLGFDGNRSEEHTSELQSHLNLVCR